MIELDHIAVAGRELTAAVAHAEAALGVRVPAGGAHPLMATHNHLLGLGGDCYLEVIAPDPGAVPARPRWFGLDDAPLVPRLATWIARTDDLAGALARLPPLMGRPVRATRGALEWLISVPDDGALPFGGAMPTLIQWPVGVAPARGMPDAGCRLLRLDVAHPEAAMLRALLAGMLDDARVAFNEAPAVALRAVVATPAGERVLA
jgi:hypothetical protein